MYKLSLSEAEFKAVIDSVEMLRDYYDTLVSLPPQRSYSKLYDRTLCEERLAELVALREKLGHVGGVQ